MRILLVEDDQPLAEATGHYLRHKAYTVDLAQDLAQAQEALSQASYAVVLLDLHLPDGDGLQLMARLRQLADRPVVVVLTARDQISDRIRGLDAGADDYLTKPYDPDELLARLRAIERRRSGSALPQLHLSGGVVIDLNRESVSCAGHAVVLTAKEWALLRAMTVRPQRIHPKEALQDALYGWDDGADSNTVEVFISRLRRKLGSDCIQTLRGLGYRLALCTPAAER